MGVEQFLKDLKKHGIENEIPNISEVNARFLRDLIKIRQPKRMLEIGTANGYSAIHFALELQKIGGHLTTIEFSSLSHGLASENFQQANVSQTITSICGNALDVIPTLEGEFEMVFIDGMKRRTLDFLV